MITQPRPEDGTVDFFIRLGESDWQLDTASWRCPALDLPGSTIKDIFSSGKCIDNGRYRVIESQSYIHWTAGTKAPDQITVLVSVNSETRSKLNKDIEISVYNEGKWKKLSIISPIIVAIISGLFLYYSKSPDPILTINALPSNVSNSIYAAKFIINGSDASIPYRAAIKSDTTAEIDFRKYIMASDKIIKFNEIINILSKNIIENINSIDDNISQVSSKIINSCSGGAHGITPENGLETIALLDTVRESMKKIKEQADKLPVGIEAN